MQWTDWSSRYHWVSAFFAQNQSFTFIIKGEEVVLTESELQNELTKTQDQLTLTSNDLNTIQNNLIATQNELAEVTQILSTKEEEITSLKEQINTSNANKSLIEKAKYYAESNDYLNALNILNIATNKTDEINMYINDYTIQYELFINNQINDLIQNNRLDEAKVIAEDALEIIPQSQLLKNKQQEIENSFPKNMVDVVPAYQSVGNAYREYSSKKSGATEYFTMGGVKYTNGITFNADYNHYSEVTWAIYNLDNNYNTLEFIVCHVDGTDNGDQTSLQIFYDGVLTEEIPLTCDMSPTPISLNIDGIKQLKMQVITSGYNDPFYGLGNPIIK